MTLDEVRIRRYARQVLLAEVGGAGQERLLASSLLLHGDAPLCAAYLAAAGLGRLLVTGPEPELAGRDPALVVERAEPGAPADLVLDLGDGAAWRRADGRPRLWGGAFGTRVVLDGEPRSGPAPAPAARAQLETLAAGEALWRLLGHAPRAWDFGTGDGQSAP